MTLSTAQSLDHFQWHQAFLAPARDELFSLPNDGLLLRLYFDPNVVKEAAPMLRQYCLSVCILALASQTANARFALR